MKAMITFVIHLPRMQLSRHLRFLKHRSVGRSKYKRDRRLLKKILWNHSKPNIQNENKWCENLMMCDLRFVILMSDVDYMIAAFRVEFKLPVWRTICSTFSLQLKVFHKVDFLADM